MITTNNQLKYKKICITGTLLLMTREDAVKEIEKAGGFFDKSVTGSTHILVVADKPGATKVNAAKRLKTKILTERQFIDMIYDKPSLYLTEKPVKTPDMTNVHLESRDW